MSGIGSNNGWLEAAIAWEVCASLHRQYCKGKDALFTTRQSDFVKHAENARRLASRGQAPAGAAQAAPVAWRYHCEGDPVKWYFSVTPSLLGLYQPLYASAQAAPVDADVQTAIDSAPEPFRRLGEFLARTLDEDQWATAQSLLLGGLVAVQEGRDTQGDIDHYNENMG